MFRTSDMILITAMVGAAAATYSIKHRAENTLADIRAIDRKIQLEKDSIDVLNAEWSLLTQPARLQRLAETFKGDLQLQPIDPKQIGGVTDIASRPLAVEDILAGDGATAPAADPVETGGVKP
jgi:hypothetical protein